MPEDSWGKGEKMAGKKYEYLQVTVPLSYGEDDTPNIHRIVDLIDNKELSGWRFFKALKFVRDKKTDFFRPMEIMFRRPKHGKLRTTIFNYMAVTLADDGAPLDSGSSWEKVGVIERDALKRPWTILFRRPYRG